MNNRIYISGKITGTTDYLDRFKTAEKTLTANGWIVVNPAALCNALPKLEWEEYMDICLKALAVCDSIYMLDGYETSKGANAELRYATRHNMNIIYEGGLSGVLKNFIQCETVLY